jgi:hypothetical protein
MTDFVAYYRVSTDKQGAAGLGMDAQREAVSRFIGQRGKVGGEYIEVESGRKVNRPRLKAAQEECRDRQATLVIAKLDRLARNVHFISGLPVEPVNLGCHRVVVHKTYHGATATVDAMGCQEDLSRATRLLDDLALICRKGKSDGAHHE